MRTLSLVLLLSAAACTDGVYPSDDDDDGSLGNDCAGGLNRSTNTSIIISTMLVGGISYTLGFDDELIYAGNGPAACMNDGGTRGSFLFDSANDPFARLTMGPTEVGVFPANEAPGELTLDVFGVSTPVVVEPENWTSGTLSVDVLSNPMTWQLSADGNVDGITVGISVFGEASP